MRHQFTKPARKPKQKCPQCGAMKVGLANHIKAKHPPISASLAAVAITVRNILGGNPGHHPGHHYRPRPPKPRLIEEPLVCPDCGAPMGHRWGLYGLYYACSERDATGCRGAHGANSDGTPVGIPADARTRKMRMAAHQSFDPLWKKSGSPVFSSRAEAYAWMDNIMGLGPGEAHIGRFGIADCKKLVEHIWDAFGD
jgi:hypothetical protein